MYKNHSIKYVLVDVKKSNYKQEFAKKLAAQGGTVNMMPPVTPGIPPNPYQQAPPYSQPNPYGCPPGWGGAYPPPTQYPQPGGPYANYVPPQNGVTPGWNSSYPAPNAAGWPQNGYNPPVPNQLSNPALHTGGSVPTNGWNSTNTTMPATGKTFGNYQQTYNGGPQKAGGLQGNRMNPYNVSSTGNYGKY